MQKPGVSVFGDMSAVGCAAASSALWVEYTVKPQWEQMVRVLSNCSKVCFVSLDTAYL